MYVWGELVHGFIKLAEKTMCTEVPGMLIGSRDSTACLRAKLCQSPDLIERCLVSGDVAGTWSKYIYVWSKTWVSYICKYFLLYPC